MSKRKAIPRSSLAMSSEEEEYFFQALKEQYPSSFPCSADRLVDAPYKELLRYTNNLSGTN